ncbi:5102_t:CDS:2, partial [Dentiscutata erythropus]
GAPAHFNKDVRKYLDKKFPNRYLKTEVFKMPPNNIKELKQRIINKCENIISEQLAN